MKVMMFLSYPMVNTFPDRFHDRYDIRLLCEVHDTNEALQLPKSHDNSRTSNESNDDGVRQEVYDKSNPAVEFGQRLHKQ
jgi:hypothetical protein